MESAPLFPGETVSHYRIVEKLGSGGMGVVYKAEDLKLGRFVALKFLSDDLARDPQALNRFQLEARAASALNHPNICMVFETDECDGRAFIAMELLEGQTLRERIDGRALSTSDFVDLALQIAEALEAAHARGILHRDIKPENIFVSQQRRAKVLDFGLAKLAATPGQHTVTAGGAALNVNALLTSPGVALGTVAYMSPEQVRADELDARSDLFSLGTVLYEMATGKRAFNGNTSGVLFDSILNRTPTSALRVNPELRPEVDVIIQKLLEKDPEIRYQTAADLRGDLKRLKRDSESGRSSSVASATPNAPGEESATTAAVPKASTRRLWPWVAGAAAAVVLAAGILYFRWRAPVVADPSAWTQLTNFTDAATDPAFSQDGHLLAFMRDKQIYVKLFPKGEAREVTHNGARKMDPVFSRDGSRIAYMNGTSWDTWVVPALGGEARPFLPNASGLSWIDEGHVLFSAIDKGPHMNIVTATESRGDERVVYAPPSEGGMAHVSRLSPDHKTLLISREMDGTGWLPCRTMPFDGSKAPTVVGPADAQCGAAEWSPDGKWIYMTVASGGGHHLYRQRFPDGKPEQLTFGPTEELGIAVAPDGRSLVTSVGNSERSIIVHSAEGEKPISSQAYTAFGIFSIDGTRLYYLSDPHPMESFPGGELRVTDLKSGETQSPLPGVQMSLYDISYDEKLVLYVPRSTERASRIWIAPLDRHTAPRELSPANGADESDPTFAPNGDIYFSTREGQASFLYTMKPDGSGRRKVYAGAVMYVGAVSPDGNWTTVTAPVEGEEGKQAIFALPNHGGQAVRICRGQCDVQWTSDNKYILISNSADVETARNTTYAIPLKAGKEFPEIPAGGFDSDKTLMTLPGTITINQGGISPGPNPAIYAFARAAQRSNLYQIPIK